LDIGDLVISEITLKEETRNEKKKMRKLSLVSLVLVVLMSVGVLAGEREVGDFGSISFGIAHNQTFWVDNHYHNSISQLGAFGTVDIPLRYTIPSESVRVHTIFSFTYLPQKEDGYRMYTLPSQLNMQLGFKLTF
jgi:hypothetical protein